MADPYEDTLNTFKKSAIVVDFLESGYAYAIFPSVGKGGIGIGGARGKGRVYRNGKVTGRTTLSKITIGFQLGGQVFSELIVFQDKSAYDRFTRGSYEFSADASAVAIKIGAQAQAGTTGSSVGAGKESLDAAYVNGMVVFITTKGGLMYEAAIGGQKFSFKPRK